VAVNFNIPVAPILPTATGQLLIGGNSGAVIAGSGSENLQIYTDSNGYASAQFKTGDRRGNYTVMADYNSHQYGTGSFTEVEREIFNMTLDNTSREMNIFAGADGTSTASGDTVTITSNAGAYDMVMAMNGLPFNPMISQAIENWNTITDRGFAWMSLDSYLPNAFNPIGVGMIMFSHSGTEINAVHTLPALHFKLDFTKPAGVYQGTIEYRAEGIGF
jgi:hypothetical protein